MLQHTASPLRAGALALTLGIVLLGVVPYRVIASGTPAAPSAPVAPVVVAPPATPTVAPSPRAAPRAVVVADARDMPAPLAPPAPPAAPTIAPPAPPPPPTLRTRGTLSISDTRGGDAYVLIEGDDVTVVGHSDDIHTAQRLQ